MRKILIMNRLGIGDVVLTTALAHIIKKNINARIGYVVAEKSVDILFNHPYIDDVFSYNRKREKNILLEIKEKKYTEAMIVDGRFTSTLLAWQAGCKLLNLGFEITIGKKRIFCRKENAKKAIEDFASYTKLLNIEYDKSDLYPVIGKCESRRISQINEWLSKLKNETKKIVLVIPRSAFWGKDWDKKHLGDLNIFLNKLQILPIYIGGSNDYSYIESIQGKKINVAGKFTLRELPVLAEHAVFVLSMCTGPMHVVSSIKTPIVAIYGPSDPKRWAPNTAIVVQSNLSCVPCQRWAECPKPEGKRCMNEISFERVKDIIKCYL